jgi:hypothetical protein
VRGWGYAVRLRNVSKEIKAMDMLQSKGWKHQSARLKAEIEE